MKTRFVALLVAAAMLLGMCSVAMADEYTVNFLNCWSGASASFPEDIAGNPSAALIKEKFGITLNEADPGGNMTEVDYLNMMFSAGNVPDVVNAPYWGPNQGGEGYVIINGAKEGMIKDIAPYLDQFPTLKAIYDEQSGIIGKSAMLNLIKNPEYPEGAIYFIPVGINMDAAEYQTVYGDSLFARQDVLDALGVKAEDITTVDELIEFLRKVQASDLTDWTGKPIIPIGTGHDGWRNVNIVNWFRGNNISDWRLTEDGKTTYFLFTDFIEKRIETFHTLFSEGLIDVECLTQTDEVANAKCMQGSYAVISTDANHTVNAVYYGMGINESHPEAKWVPLGLKNLDGNNCVDVYTPGWSGGAVTFFSADIPEDKLLAVLSMMEWLNSEEGAAFNWYGIEGTTFEYDEKGRPALIPEVKAAIATDVKVKYNNGIEQFNNFTCYNMNNTRWPKTDDELTAQEADYKAMCDYFRPRVEVNALPVDELLKDWEGYADLNDNLAVLDPMTTVVQLYYVDDPDEVASRLADLRQRALDFGIQDACDYIDEHITEDYAY